MHFFIMHISNCVCVCIIALWVVWCHFVALCPCIRTTYPTEPFTALWFSNPPIGEFNVAQERLTTDFEELKF